MVRHIIWDWNGTLFDDVQVNLDIMNRMLRRRSLPPIPDRASYREIFCFPVSLYYQKAGLTFENETFEAAAAEYIEAYPRESLACSLAGGAKEALGLLKEAGIGQSVLSASEKGLLLSQLERLGVKGYFSPILGLNDAYARSKIALGQAFLAASGLSPEEVLLIGDTTHDFETARALGCRAVLVASGHQSRRVLNGCGCPVEENALSAVRRILRERFGG